MYKKMTIISLLLVLIDQIVKLIVNNFCQLNSSIEVIKDFFYITKVNNYGAAWSILDGNRLFLIVIGIIAIVAIILFFIKNKNLTNKEILVYSLLIGGIIGNLVDRVLLGYVIDYLDFTIFNYDYPIFNFADICIVISALLMLISIFKEDICKKLKLKKMNLE